MDIQNIVKSIKGDAKVGERYMTLGTTLYYEKKMSYDEGIQIGKEQGIQIGKERGIQIGKEQGIQIGEEKNKRLIEELIELGVSPELIEKAKETIN